MHRITLRVAILLLTGLIAGANGSTRSASPLQQLYMLKEIQPGIERVGIIWNEDRAESSGLLTQIQQAAASTGVTIFLAYTKEITDVAPAFRDLIRRNDAQAIWILDSDDPVVSSRIGRGFLIKNTTSQGIPLIAPSAGWVEEGAHMSFFHDGTTVRLAVNKRSADAADLTIPTSYLERTDFLAIN